MDKLNFQYLSGLMTRHLLIIALTIFWACGSGSKNQSAKQLDSLKTVVETKDQEIFQLKQELAETKSMLQELKDEQLQSEMNQKADCACNINYVRLAKQSIETLNKELLLGMLCTFNETCENNVEYGEFSNETLHEIIATNPELFIATLHQNQDNLSLRTILDEIESPIHDGFDLEAHYQGIKGVYGYDTTKDAVLTAMEVSLDNANIEYFKADDCIFDLTTQTDEFLQGIPVLKNYVWNKHIHTARIQLADQQVLYVTRGGCYHFGVEAELHIPGIEMELAEALQKVVWIAEVLNEQFEAELVKEAIEQGAYTSDDLSFMSFTEERLADEVYTMSFNQTDKASVVSLKWYMY